jgi:carbonic anhydrase
MEDPEYFIKRSVAQTPKYLLIGCSDSRVPPNEMTKTDPGEIFIHRNIANQVIHSDLNCMSVIQFAIEYLNVEHVIIMGHTKCGGIYASKNKSFKGLIENWIHNIKDVAYLHKNELENLKTDEEYFEKLTVLNIKHQVMNVCKTPFAQKAWAKGKNLHIHGWLMDIETGIIKDLKMNNKEWNNLKNFYDFTFK